MTRAQRLRLQPRFGDALRRSAWRRRRALARRRRDAGTLDLGVRTEIPLTVAQVRAQGDVDRLGLEQLQHFEDASAIRERVLR